MNARDQFAKRLKRRADALGLSDAAVARRAGVESRTYGTYASGRSEPKFDCLLRICDALETHPNLPARADG